MDEDNSNDVMLIENTEDEDSKASGAVADSRPLMLLFERLISNDSKSNTVLTNAQILLILNQEFNIDVTKLHELEKDIHINIVKKFLKDWPQWDVFDRVINKLKKKSAENEIKAILEEKYTHLKEYLRTMIETATPLAKETVKKLKPRETEKLDAEVNSVVLEIYCTRKMLNQFIYNQPNAAENNSLFHLMNFTPYELDGTTPHYSFRSMLHWYGVNITIDFPNFQFSRYTNHKLNHVLVNEELGPRELNEELDTSLYISNSNTKSVCISNITSKLDKILQHYQDKIEYKMVEEIFNIIKSDLNFDSATVMLSTVHRQRLNRYPYTRKLYTEVKGTSHCNMYIEETITPILSWQIGKLVDFGLSVLPNLQSWLHFDCNECQQKFHGAEFLTVLRDHFRIYHIDEPDWICTNCRRAFNIAEVTELGWKHECESSN